MIVVCFAVSLHSCLLVCLLRKKCKHAIILLCSEGSNCTYWVCHDILCRTLALGFFAARRLKHRGNCLMSHVKAKLAYIQLSAAAQWLYIVVSYVHDQVLALESSRRPVPSRMQFQRAICVLSIFMIKLLEHFFLVVQLVLKDTCGVYVFFFAFKREGSCAPVTLLQWANFP